MLDDALQTQKRELELRLSETYIERQVPARVEDSDLVKVVLGPRRAGKSFFAMHLLRSFGAFGYVNFDDERLVDLGDTDQLVAAIDSIYGSPRYLLLDEIQNLSRWELFVNRLQRQGYRLFITGSNAHLLSRELATHLTGRHIPILIFPFSFAEYVNAQDRELTQTEKAQSLRDYLEMGGLPEPLLKGIDRGAYLATLWDSVLYKDIVRRHRIRSVQGMDDLALYFLSNTASEYSFRTLANVTRCKSFHTVEKYVGHLEEAFLFFSLKRFSWKVREQSRSPKKVYCVDNGFVTSKGFQFSSNVGKLCENLVAIELKKRELQGRSEVFFWKNPQQEEVDFVVKKGRQIDQLIQVCWEMRSEKTRDREVRALLKASRDLDCGNLLVLTDTKEGEEQVEWFGISKKVQFLPLWKWFLGVDVINSSQSSR